MRAINRWITKVIGISAVLMFAISAHAASYNETVSGDLSNSQTAPTPLTLTLGSNSVIGNVNGSAGDSQDWIVLTVPTGDQMTSFVNAAYSSSANDAQGFTGFRFGSSFGSNSASSAGSYAGYAHFGIGSTNAGVAGGAPTTTVGVDLLSTAHYMDDNSTGGTAAGATGYTPPLGPGTYTFLIQQLGGSTNYEFDMNVSAVPEPAAISLFGFGVIGLLMSRRLRRK
jgi:hypothetical protein